MVKTALVTGTNGAIGKAIVEKLGREGYSVCGIDVRDEGHHSGLDFSLTLDLESFVLDEATRAEALSQIHGWLAGSNLDIVVNNAAYQYVSDVHPMPVEEMTRSYNINVLAPYFLVTHLADVLTPQTASVVNIGSIHARLTKPGFLAYSMTKSAIATLTKGLAMDYADRFRVNCIEPASIETPMLLDGFKNAPEKLSNLASFHPQKRIGTPNEVAELVWMISSPSVRFLHGACIDISGGISAKLHDPG